MSISTARKLLRDWFGVARVLGNAAALQWLFHLLTNYREVVSKRNLQPADEAMGSGPFHIKYSNSVQFLVSGSGAFSGIREMFVRDVYLREGLLTIDDHAVVLDLGANIGNFTNLALAHSPTVRVIAVEPSLILQDSMLHSVSLNVGFADRLTSVRAMLGTPENTQIPSDDPNYHGVRWITENDLIHENKLTHVDLLKCDIEGGEFGLFTSKSRLLQMSDKIAIEVHAFAGDVENFIRMLEEQDFRILHVQRDPDGTATVLGKKR